MKLSDWMVLGASTYPLCRGAFHRWSGGDESLGCLLTVTAKATGYVRPRHDSFDDGVILHLEARFPALHESLPLAVHFSGGVMSIVPRGVVMGMYDANRNGRRLFTEQDVIDQVRLLETHFPNWGWDWEPPAHDNTEALRRIAGAVEDQVPAVQRNDSLSVGTGTVPEVVDGASVTEVIR